MPVSMIERLDTSALSDEQVYAEVIKGITEGSTVLPLMTRLPDLTKKQGKLAVLSALPQAYFVSGDTGIKQTTKAAWENVYITSEELAVIIPISEAVLDDVDYDIWAAVRQPLIDVFYSKIDRAILHSDNRPSSWPIGVATQAAATGHQVAETAELYQDLLGVGGVLNLIEADGYSANGAVAQTGFKAKMRGLVDANKQPIFRSAYSNGNAGSMVYELDGNPIHFPANGSMATGDPLAVFGDFKQAVFAMRKELTFNGIPVLIDSTFATPFLFRPIEHGADIVIHSATKFIGGHGTVMGGVIVDGGKFDWAQNDKFPGLSRPNPSYHGVVFSQVAGNLAYIIKLRTTLLRDTGATISPFNSFLLLQGLETLSLRVERHVQNALAVVDYLKNHPLVKRVNHPSLATGRAKELYDRYYPNGGASIFTFEIDGTEEQARKFTESLELFSLLANVADVKSLVIHPASTTHSQLSQEELLTAGIKPNTIRLSIGTEHIDDIIADLDHGFAAIRQ
ncbi:MAG: phage major capsid protein [Eubacteriales bacterium]|nr:phage major capsid protein [Eubacteriales bacterium]